MLNDVGALTELLMAVESTRGAEAEVIRLAEQTLLAAGWKTVRIPVSPGRDNLYARPGDRGCPVTFSTHLDTVPPFIAPRRDGRVLHGRGACDAKGIAAAMIV